MLDFFRGVLPWGKFRRLLSQLGSDSKYITAQQNDPAIADHVARSEKPDDPAWAPQPAEFTLMHELAAEIRDRLGVVCALLADLPVAVDHRHTPPASFPRPETELVKARKRVKDERDQAYDDRLVADVERAQQRWRERHALGQREPAQG